MVCATTVLSDHTVFFIQYMFQIKNHMWIFVNALIENPTFDSQTKETMTLQSKSFGSTCELSEKFFQAALKCGIVEAIMTWVRFKQQETLDKKCSSKKTSKLKVYYFECKNKGHAFN